MKLKIVESSWSGWTPDYKSEDYETEYELELNKKYIVDTWIRRVCHEDVEEFSFEILEIFDSYIKIHTFQDYLGHNALNHNEYGSNEFLVVKGEILELSENKKDAGKIYKLFLL